MWKITLALFSSALLFAASPAGKWIGDTPGMSGDLEKTTFDLKVEGEKVTGNVVLSSGSTYAIENGTFKADNLKFHITVKMGRDTKLIYTGKLDGEQMKMTREMEGIGRKVEFTAKHAQ